MKPPPIIGAGLRVLEYAVIAEPVRFTGNLQLYVEGALLGEVPRLAIYESLDDDELFLCHCDDNWDVIGIQSWNTAEDSAVSSVDDVKARAEKYYAGISAQWIAHGTSVEEARAYQESMVGEDRCSFCARTLYDVQSLVEGKGGARICNFCIAALNEGMSSNQTRA
jgi:ClpX C4-type zinc finger